MLVDDIADRIAIAHSAELDPSSVAHGATIPMAVSPRARSRSSTRPPGCAGRRYKRPGPGSDRMRIEGERCQGWRLFDRLTIGRANRPSSGMHKARWRSIELGLQAIYAEMRELRNCNRGSCSRFRAHTGRA
jgi:hypothetical protein